jgi:hypothetical protein
MSFADLDDRAGGFEGAKRTDHRLIVGSPFTPIVDRRVVCGLTIGHESTDPDR